MRMCPPVASLLMRNTDPEPRSLPRLLRSGVKRTGSEYRNHEQEVPAPDADHPENSSRLMLGLKYAREELILH